MMSWRYYHKDFVILNSFLFIVVIIILYNYLGF